jgi:hypothetical protein
LRQTEKSADDRRHLTALRILSELCRDLACSDI